MKPTPYRFLLLLCCLISAYTLRAQDTSKIPSLKVWYEIPNVERSHFIEDFDTVNNGLNALVINRTWGEGQTLYMTSKIDTVSHFTWGRWENNSTGRWAAKIDFNGDGVSDYMLDRGIVYRGIAKNTPPDPTPVAKYQIPFWRLDRRCIADFNGDGKEDLLDRTVEDPTIDKAPNDVIGQIILGNSDLTKMKVLEMPVVKGVAEDIQNIVSAWRENGKNYLVLYEYTPDTFDPRSDGFVLYEFTITADSAVHYTELDYIPFKSWPSNVVPYYSYSSSFVWHSRDMKEHTLVVTLGPNIRTSEVYSIIAGHFVHSYHKQTPEYEVWPLAYSVKNMAENGYVRCFARNCFLYHGDPAKDSTRIARFPDGIEGNEYVIQHVTSIGDVNNDGKGDIGVVYIGNNTGILRIYLGADSVSSVSTADSQAAVLSLPDPQVSSDGLLSVLLNINHPSQYTLEIFSVRGQKLHVLMDEYLQIGEYSRTLQLSGTNLPSGMYNLRLSDGTRMVDKGILITR